MGSRSDIQGEVIMEFEGKVAIVTGATSGIGMATARRFAEQGGQVAAAGRKKEILAKLETSKIKTYAVDLTSERETSEFVGQVVEDFGGIDVLVNAAGTSIPPKSSTTWPTNSEVSRSLVRLKDFG